MAVGREITKALQEQRRLDLVERRLELVRRLDVVITMIDDYLARARTRAS